MCGGYHTTWTEFPGGGGALTLEWTNCHYSGGAGGGHGDPGLPPEQPVEQDFEAVPLTSLGISPLSAKLACALDRYTRPDARPKYPIHNANGYAYSKGSLKMYRATWIDPSEIGPGWAPLGGTTKSSPPRTTLIFRYAHEPYRFDGSVFYHITDTGMWPIQNPPANHGYLSTQGFTTFEMSLFSAAHEVAHQNGLALTGLEAQANWYGYAAVLAYRADHGAKCD